jgi:hypothetical protein
MTSGFQLFRDKGALYLRFRGQEKPIPVLPVWTRPLTARGRDLSFLDSRRQEVARIPSLDYLDGESRSAVQAELGNSYLIPVILGVSDLRAHLGTLYWVVETDAGHRRFALKDPVQNVTWLSDDHLVLRDCAGNRYEIKSIAAMDRQSRHKISLVL